MEEEKKSNPQLTITGSLISDDIAALRLSGSNSLQDASKSTENEKFEDPDFKPIF